MDHDRSITPDLHVSVHAELGDEQRRDVEAAVSHHPLGRLALAWTRLVANAHVAYMQVRYIVVRDARRRIAGVGILYVVRDVDVLSYAGPSARFLSRLIRRVWARGLTAKVGFLEVPMRNMSGVFLAAGLDLDTRRKVRALIEAAARDALPMHLLCIKDELCESLPAPAPAQMRVPFLPNAELRIRWPTFEEYLLTLRRSARGDIRDKLKRFARYEATIDAIDPARIDPERLRTLMACTADRAIRRGSLPLVHPVSSQLFAELHTLPAQMWTLIGTMHAGVQFAFGLLLRGQGTLCFTLCGVDAYHGPKSSAYFVQIYKGIELAINGGFHTMNLGATTYDVKKRLGCELVPTWLRLEVMHPLLRPLAPLLRSSLGKTAPPAEA